MNLGTRMTAAGKFAHLSSLEDVVEEHLRIHEREFGGAHHDPVVEYAAEAPDLGTAIKRACEGRRRDGKMFSKGSCVRTRSRRNLEQNLLGREALLRRCRTFEEIHDVVHDAIVPGIGPMIVYNVAERIGAYLHVWPERYVYVHAGPMIGWRRLTGLMERRFRIPVWELPEPLRKLRPHDVEDLLCEFRDLLHPGMIR